MTRILAINGSYRENGITSQVLEIMLQSARNAGAEIECVLLRDCDIRFCLNCRECTQLPGDAPGLCVQHDEMHELIEKIEQADAFILASPTNFGSVTAVFKRFMERLVVYAYWPWGKDYPVSRKKKARRKKAVLVSSCAAPGLFGRLLYGTHKQLRMTADTIGADVVNTLFTGLIAKQAQQKLPEKAGKKAREIAAKLAVT